MAPIIEIKDLTKRYGRLTAVDHLSLTVEAGGIYGFVGPNGAGKTSTMRMLTTLLKPTAGEAWVAGHSVTRAPRAVRRAIGYMPDFFGVYDDMTVWEYLDFFAACYEIPQSTRLGLIDDLLELVELKHRRNDMVDSLSRGMKQRLCLARTLAHDPQVLILDEPASGLDPRARVEIRELLVELSRLGKTVFFSTHILADAAEICTEVGIIEAGKLVAAGPLDEMQARLVPHREVTITLLDRADEARELLLAAEGVSDVREVTPSRGSSTGKNGGRVALEVQFVGDEPAVGRLLAALVERGLPVVQFGQDTRDLEEVFMRATKGIVS
ncbi:MAG: ABC transporter ATP-binding protein [Chloroflexi bacterium]|nr:ABC transporter ATP-binding protein [Chloroflexota bacterium]